mmetsp:Transcript_26245/g.66139  ORF Transcript_26245/g.66139 Transcript_26245/m.66139 type:complete len:229 (+) Transcript_26245:3223-3909(+)
MTPAKGSSAELAPPKFSPPPIPTAGPGVAVPLPKPRCEDSGPLPAYGTTREGSWPTGPGSCVPKNPVSVMCECSLFISSVVTSSSLQTRSSSPAASATCRISAASSQIWNSRSRSSTSAASGVERSRLYVASFSKLQLCPIWIAVSTLSPVNTQNLIPADCNCAIVSGTWSCSLSSTPVHPTRFRCFSISSTAAATWLVLSASLSSTAPRMLAKFALHCFWYPAGSHR